MVSELSFKFYKSSLLFNKVHTVMRTASAASRHQGFVRRGVVSRSGCCFLVNAHQDVLFATNSRESRDVVYMSTSYARQNNVAHTAVVACEESYGHSELSW